MKFLRVDITNFRVLRDVTVEFSTDEIKKLTVIRAQNDSGKTTLLTALQWALYGENVLPNKGENYRLHPIDWDEQKSSVVNIEVCLEFENVSYRRIGKALHKERKVFCLIRSVQERLDGLNWERYNEKVNLSELVDGLFKQIPRSEILLDNILPLELREVFFTDGDRALSFIEAGLTAQRRQVENAIKSLLGISIVENAITHLKTQAKKLDRQVQNVTSSGSLQKLCENIEHFEKNIPTIESSLLSYNQDLRDVESRVSIIEKEIYEALKQGNKDSLRKQLMATQGVIRKNNIQRKHLEDDHSKVFQNADLPIALIAPMIKRAERIVDLLHGKTSLPTMTLSVMELLLKDKGQCLCGESLDDDSVAGKKRLKHIQDRLNDALTQNEISGEIADFKLIIRDKKNQSTTAVNSFQRMLQKIQEKTIELDEDTQEKMLEERALTKKIGLINDVDVVDALKEKEGLQHKRDELRLVVDRSERELAGLKRELHNYEDKKREIIKREKLNVTLLSTFNASQDILTVFLKTYTSIVDTQLKKVSDTMDRYFMEMISGGGVNENAIIVRSEITDKFDIKVFGPGNRQLNPDRDLNGASRRALTLSLILALTTVSGVEAPNIIDTPLGMMSGHVKENVTERVVNYSSQPILFLTRSEITGCETILEKYTGSITTFSNPSHFPNSLKNDLKADCRQIVTCRCTHNQYCDICERVGDAENQFLNKNVVV